MALTAGTWTLTTQVEIDNASIAAQGNASPNTLAVPSYGPSSAGQQALTFGTASGKINQLLAIQDTLNAGANAVYDLYDGSLKDVYGGAAAMRTLRGIAIVIESGGDAAGLTIGGAASNPNILFFGNVNDTWTIFPSGPPFAGGSDAGVVVDATHRNFKLLNNGAVPVAYTIYLAAGSL